MATTPEGRIKRAVTALLKEYTENGLYYEMPVPGGWGKSGLDYHGCYKGRFFAIETKAPGKSPTQRQLQTISLIARAGGWVFVIDDVSNEAFEFNRLRDFLATVEAHQ